VVSNVQRDLLEGYKEVIVVVTNEEALEKVERQLREASPSIPNRVRIALRDEFYSGPRLCF